MSIHYIPETKYTIVSKPRAITFRCPYCKEDVEIEVKGGYAEDVDIWEGGYIKCPECNQTVNLEGWEYD